MITEIGERIIEGTGIPAALEASRNAYKKHRHEGRLKAGIQAGVSGAEMLAMFTTMPSVAQQALTAKGQLERGAVDTIFDNEGMLALNLGIDMFSGIIATQWPECLTQPIGDTVARFFLRNVLLSAATGLASEITARRHENMQM